MQSLLGNTRKPDLTFYKNGTIDIASRVSKMLNLQSRDVIDIMSDNGEYYLYIKYKQATGRHFGAVNATTKGGTHFRTYSKALSEAMQEICGVQSDIRLSAGDVISTEHYGVIIPIITKLLL